MTSELLDSQASGFVQLEPDGRVSELTYLTERWIETGSFTTELAEHPYWELFCQIEGCTEWFGVDGKKLFTTTKSSFGVLAPGITHRCLGGAGESHHFFSCGIRLEPFFALHPDLARTWQPDHCAVYEDSHALVPVFRALAKEVCLNLPGRTRMITMLTESLFIEASRVLLRSEEGGQDLSAMHPAVARVRELLDNNPSGDWNLPYLSRIAGIAPTYLAHLFKSETGTSPKQYLKNLRLTLARDMLVESNKSVTAISKELGFCNSQYFATRFKQAFHMTPLELRQLARDGRPLPEPDKEDDPQDVLRRQTFESNCAQSSKE